MTSLVSILMPAFNAGRYISESIESVMGQTYGHWELIIVNDGSGDNTLAIAEAWQQKDPRIQVASNEMNRGLGFTTNVALKRAKGKFIAKLDADDVATNDWLSTRIEHLLKHPSLVAVSGSRILINDEGHEIRRLHEELSPLAVSWRLIFGNPVIHPGIVFRAMDSLQYAELRYLEDWELWSKLIFNGDIEVVNDHKIRYRVHANNTSGLLRQRETMMPVIQKIMHRLSARFIEVKPSADIAWYLFRDREPFKGEPGTIKEAIRILEQTFSAFVQAEKAIDKKTFSQLKLSLWDEIFHLMRLGKTDMVQLRGIFNSWPLSIREIMMNSHTWHIGKKGMYLYCRNLLLK